MYGVESVLLALLVPYFVVAFIVVVVTSEKHQRLLAIEEFGGTHW